MIDDTDEPGNDMPQDPAGDDEFGGAEAGNVDATADDQNAEGEAYEDHSNETAAERKKRKKAVKKKIGPKTKIALGVGAFLALIIWYGLQPIVGTIRFGICKSFIELQIPYPPTIQVNQVEEYEMAVRIYYSHIDAFGSSRLNMIECNFRPDPRTGLALDIVRINRDDVPAEQVAAFNPSIPFIIQNPPDLRLPVFKGDALVHLKIDYN